MRSTQCATKNSLRRSEKDSRTTSENSSLSLNTRFQHYSLLTSRLDFRENPVLHEQRKFITNSWGGGIFSIERLAICVCFYALSQKLFEDGPRELFYSNQKTLSDA